MTKKEDIVEDTQGLIDKSLLLEPKFKLKFKGEVDVLD